MRFTRPLSNEGAFLMERTMPKAAGTITTAFEAEEREVLEGISRRWRVTRATVLRWGLEWVKRNGPPQWDGEQEGGMAK